MRPMTDNDKKWSLMRLRSLQERAMSSFIVRLQPRCASRDCVTWRRLCITWRHCWRHVAYQVSSDRCVSGEQTAHNHAIGRATLPRVSTERTLLNSTNVIWRSKQAVLSCTYSAEHLTCLPSAGVVRSPVWLTHLCNNRCMFEDARVTSI